MVEAKIEGSAATACGSSGSTDAGAGMEVSGCFSNLGEGSAFAFDLLGYFRSRDDKLCWESEAACSEDVSERLRVSSLLDLLSLSSIAAGLLGDLISSPDGALAFLRRAAASAASFEALGASLDDPPSKPPLE